MTTAKNMVSLTGNLVADPEKISEKVVKFRIAVQRAASDRDDKDNTTGFFNVTYFLNEGNFNSKFVSGQLSAGNLKKGSSVGIVGELRQEYWKNKEGQRTSSVAIVADSIEYAGGSSQRPNADASASTSQESSDSESGSIGAFEF